MNERSFSSNNSRSVNIDRNKNNLQYNSNLPQNNNPQIGEKELQLLAEKVYECLRNHLSIELERKLGFTPTFSLRSNRMKNIARGAFDCNLSGNNLKQNLSQSNDKSFNLEREEIDELVETLTRKIYILLEQRIRSDKERSRIRSDFLF